MTRTVGAAIVFILVYAVLATQLFGLAWPLPRVLPDTTRFQGNTYTKLDSDGCKTMAEWARIQHHTPISAYRTIGHLHSAVYFFTPPMVTQLRPDPTYHQYGWFLVRSGDCYVYYASQLSG